MAQNISAEQLRNFIDAIERGEEEKKAAADHVKDIYANAKSQGYEPKIIREIVRLRKMEKDARMEQDALLETYRAAIGLE